MAYNPPKGRGKGPGNGKPAAKPFTRETGTEAVNKRWEQTSVREKMAAWRAANPEAEKKPETLSRNAIRHLLEEGAPEALQRLQDEIVDASSSKGVEAAKAWLEHTIGRAKQAVEVTGAEGGPLVQVFVPSNDRDPRKD